MDLALLDEQIGQTISAAWSSNTKLTRSSQWQIYIEFCSHNGLEPVPASVLTIARFLLFKSQSPKFSTVNNYFSAIVALHKYHGFDADYRSTYFMKLLMEGLRHRLGDAVQQAVTVEQLKKMSKFMNFSDGRELMLWGSIVLSFRSLLRKSNILPDKVSEIADHVIRCSQVVWTDYGCCLEVVSTKTIESRERILRIPLVRVPGSSLCAVHYIEEAWKINKPLPDHPIFVYNNKPILYREGLSKHLVLCIGLDPTKVGFHSLRRSGAQYLNSIRVSLSDIKSAGDWRSMAVLSYLVSGLNRKLEIEKQSVQYLLDSFFGLEYLFNVTVYCLIFMLIMFELLAMGFGTQLCYIYY